MINKTIAKAHVSLAGKIIYKIMPYRRRQIKANIDQVFGDTISELQKIHLIQAFYSHLITSIKETILLRFICERKLRDKVIVVGHQYLLDITAAQKGALVLTGHFGSWEFAPLGGILNFTQFKGHFHFIRRTFKPKWLEQLLFRRYYKAGLHVIPKKNALNKVCDALEKNHAVVFVLDQHASIVNRDGIAVEFFGKKAGTYRSLASISRHTGLPVIPAASFRRPDGRHVLEFHKPIPWQEYKNVQESLYKNTYLYNQALERIILAHPEQWLWVHRRWKL